MEDKKCSEYNVCKLLWNSCNCDSCELRKIRIENEESHKKIMKKVEPIDAMSY